MLVELDDIVVWLTEHVSEYLVDGWNAPLCYNEGKEIAKALKEHFGTEDEPKKRNIPGVGGPLDEPSIR